MLVKLFRSVISIVIAALAVVFALGNRNAVMVTYSPVHDPVTVPVFVLALSGVLVGFIAGGLVVWLNEASVRADRRKQRKIIRVLEEKLVEEDEHSAKSSSHLMGFLTHRNSRTKNAEEKRL